jgi:hypothetical protein
MKRKYLRCSKHEVHETWIKAGHFLYGGDCPVIFLFLLGIFWKKIDPVMRLGAIKDFQDLQII